MIGPMAGYDPMPRYHSRHQARQVEHARQRYTEAKNAYWQRPSAQNLRKLNAATRAFEMTRRSKRRRARHLAMR